VNSNEGRPGLHPNEHMEQLLPTPGELRDRFPLSEEAVSAIKTSRAEVHDILTGADNRLLVIMGLCSLDGSVQPDGNFSAVSYAEQLKDFGNDPSISANLKIVQRNCVSKPRSNLGQTGLAQTNPVLAYEIMTQLANMEVPMAIELMSRDDADYYEDVLTVGWVGARNIEDTNIRHIASDVAIPMLFKNATSGSMVPVENAIVTASASHSVRRMRADGRIVIRQSTGNEDTGIIFRGGSISTPEQFAQQFIRLKDVKRPIIVDCSHGNSEAFGEGKKTPEAQLACIKAVRTLMKSGHLKATGVMIESYLLAGNDTSGNTPGMSLTDPCIDIDRSLEELGRLAKLQASLRSRRLGSTGLRSQLKAGASLM
jgi:3-deoxy-7-phosphoheptulonate synthase